MPQNLELDPLFDTSLQARFKRFFARVIHTRYFLIATLVHVGLLALFGKHVISDMISTTNQNFEAPRGLIEEAEVPPPRPPEVQSDPIPIASPQSPVSHAAVILTHNQNSEIHVLPPEIKRDPLTITSGSEGSPHISVGPCIDPHRFEQVKEFLKTSKIKSRRKATTAEFTCYVVKYEGGDWSCNLGTLYHEQWYNNCIQNLMSKIGSWTRNQIQANVKPEFLELSSREWIENIKPPFIFMTGHKDFSFTEAERINLREYLMLGGALWVDNSLPGRRSRFDMALRREMKLVVPDRDFEVVGKQHPVYHCWHDFKGEAPVGMNFYKEPVEVIKIGGVDAVFYTLNAYSDLWETKLTDKDQPDTSYVTLSPTVAFYLAGPHYPNKDISFKNFVRYRFYDNVNKESIYNAYLFGVNIVVHLLTRWEELLNSMSIADSSS